MDIFPKSALLLAALSSVFTWSLCRWWYRRHLHRLSAQLEALQDDTGRPRDEAAPRSWNGTPDEFESAFFDARASLVASRNSRRSTRRAIGPRFAVRGLRGHRHGDDDALRPKLPFLDTAASTRHATGPHDAA